MEKGLDTKAVDLFMDAVLTLETKEESYKFFEDLCTIKELNAIAQRFEVAKKLREECTYIDITRETGASTATISRVNRSLNYGNGSYDVALQRMNKE